MTNATKAILRRARERAMQETVPFAAVPVEIIDRLLGKKEGVLT